MNFLDGSVDRIPCTAYNHIKLLYTILPVTYLCCSQGERLNVLVPFTAAT